MANLKTGLELTSSTGFSFANARKPTDQFVSSTLPVQNGRVIPDSVQKVRDTGIGKNRCFRAPCANSSTPIDPGQRIEERFPVKQSPADVPDNLTKNSLQQSVSTTVDKIKAATESIGLDLNESLAIVGVVLTIIFLMRN